MVVILTPIVLMVVGIPGNRSILGVLTIYKLPTANPGAGDMFLAPQLEDKKHWCFATGCLSVLFFFGGGWPFLEVPTLTVPVDIQGHLLRFGIWTPKTYLKHQTSGGIWMSTGSFGGVFAGKLDLQKVVFFLCFFPGKCW